MDKLIDGVLTVFAGMLIGAACRSVAHSLDPIGVEARAHLTDAKLAAFLEAAAR